MGYDSPVLAEASAARHTHQLEGKNLVDLDTEFADLDTDFVDLDMDFADLDMDFVARVDMAILDYIGQVQQILCFEFWQHLK